MARRPQSATTENNGTEGAHRPIETTIYQRLLLSIMVTDGSFDKTGRTWYFYSCIFFPLPLEVVFAVATNDTTFSFLLYTY